MERTPGATRAAHYLPDEATNGELISWQAVTMADLGRIDDAIPFFKRAFAQDESWMELLRRLLLPTFLRTPRQ